MTLDEFFKKLSTLRHQGWYTQTEGNGGDFKAIRNQFGSCPIVAVANSLGYPSNGAEHFLMAGQHINLSIWDRNQILDAADINLPNNKTRRRLLTTLGLD